MSKRKILSCSVLCLFLSACGGSSSSGGNKLSGVYSGTYPIKLSGNGNSATDNIFITLSVNKNGNVKVVDGSGGAGSITASGKLSGNNYKASGSGSNSLDGVSCNINITYDGSVANNRSSGNSSGSGKCSGPGGTINITLSGQYDIPKTGKASTSSGKSLSQIAAGLMQ